MPSSPEIDRDERLALLLAELGDAAHRGAVPDVDAAAARHPDLADELRGLWAAAQFADAFARPSVRPAHPPAAADPPSTITQETVPATLPGVLPRTFGDYELLEELGRGGMGVVYKAWQRSLQRTVALKMILRGELATPEDLTRFQNEARAAARLDHPNLVSVYDAGQCEGQAFFSMRYIEGQTFGALLARGPLRPAEAARYLAILARAVHHAHRHGILHRDLKPSNVLLDKEGHPYVTDFGLAKVGAVAPRASGTTDGPGGPTRSGAIVGTPAYMAPEQVSGSRGTPSPASDVYSLGVILYEALTGRPPFQAPTPVDTLLLVLDQDPVRPRLLNPGVDSDLELICLKCLEKEPELRYASAADLADDLDAYLHGETPSVRSLRWRDVGGLLRRMLRETPHAVVLENWGKLWMWHSLTIFLMCVLTTVMSWTGETNPLPYLGLWGGGLVVWGAAFWKMRKRGGPVLFVERQVAHVWGGAVLATVGVFVVEWLLRLPVLTLAPMLAVVAGMTFTVKAGMLSGSFYISAAALFLTAVPMALFPRYANLLFGLVTALCFFIPGLQYHRRRLRSLRDNVSADADS